MIKLTSADKKTLGILGLAAFIMYKLGQGNGMAKVLDSKEKKETIEEPTEQGE